MKNVLFFSSVTCLFFWSCKAKNYTPDSLPENQLIFSEGGGFTGKYTTWLLLDSGQVFEKGGFGGEYSEIGKIKTSAAKKFYKSADSLSVEIMKENEPGNFNYSLEYVRDSTVLKASWSNQANIDSRIFDLYKRLRKTAAEVRKSDIPAGEEK